MDYQKCLSEQKNFYNFLLEFLNEEDHDDFENLITNIDSVKFLDNKEELEMVLKIISMISENHQHHQLFSTKIHRILEYCFNSIKKNLSNLEIFNIFRNSKHILLFLIKQKIIEVDDEIVHQIYDCHYCYFFYPEIKQFKNILKEDEINKIEQLIKDDPYYEQKREIGQNDSYICKLIQEDSAEDFIAYINRSNISLNSQINESIFETNSYLLNKNISIFEYAAFHGSIQIFQFLRLNNIELTPSLWLYAIHSNNPELIRLLEENHIIPEDKSYEECFVESIKCHHNAIANYIEDNLLNINENRYTTKIYQSIFESRNYSFFPDVFNSSIFYYLVKYDYNALIDAYLKPKKEMLCKLKNDDIKSEFYKALENKDVEMIYILFPFLTNTIDKQFKEKFENNERIIIPQSVKSIDNSIFCDFSSLKEVIIPSSVKSIGAYAFKHCELLHDVSFNPYCLLKSIEESTFMECKSLTQIIIPSSVNTIGKYAFYQCKSLQYVLIPSSVELIKQYAFSKCSSLKHVFIPSSVKKIEFKAFYNSGLKEINIPSSINTIGKNVFESCLSLEKVTIPSSVTIIESEAFRCCSFNNISIPSSVTRIGRKAFSCCKLIQISIPPSVREIEEGAFSDCYHLKQVNFIYPSSLTSIGYIAFDSCKSLKQIVIPPSVTSIGVNAFGSNTKVIQNQDHNLTNPIEKNMQSGTFLTSWMEPRIFSLDFHKIIKT